MYTKPSTTSKQCFISNLLICCYFNMNAQIKRPNQSNIANIAHHWALCPRLAQREAVCVLAHLCTNVLNTAFGSGLPVSAVKSWFTWLAFKPQRCTSLPDISLSLLHRDTSLWKAFYFCLPCSHCQEEEKSGQHGFNPSCSGIMCYQHILCLLDNETERFGEVWLGRNCFCPSSYWPSLVTSGQAMPMMKCPNPSRHWGWSIRRQWHPFALLRQPKVQVSPACHAALPRGGAENPAAPPLSREEAKHCPFPPLAEEGGSGPPRSGGWDSDKTITKLADTEKRLNVIGQATKQTSWTHGNTCSKSVLHCLSSQAIWSQPHNTAHQQAYWETG